jgi:hypothetical protein
LSVLADFLAVQSILLDFISFYFSSDSQTVELNVSGTCWNLRLLRRTALWAKCSATFRIFAALPAKESVLYDPCDRNSCCRSGNGSRYRDGYRGGRWSINSESPSERYDPADQRPTKKEIDDENGGGISLVAPDDRGEKVEQDETD